jgi:hypothetical protein
MNSTIRTRYVERLFSRSCLESSPAGYSPRNVSFSATGRATDRTHSQLHRLKARLLHSMLEQTSEEVLLKPICGAANQATGLAWESPYPLLVFPCLFAELVQAVREQGQPNLNEEFGAEVIRGYSNYARAGH